MPFFRPPLPDPSLDPFDGGVGTLSRDGVVVGHVATLLTKFMTVFTTRWQHWVWYLVVWDDGTRERSTEDYPPFLAVTEMKSGYLDVLSPTPSRAGHYDFAWLPPDEALAVKERLNITDRDF